MPHYPVQRRFVHEGVEWTARRQPGVWAGTLPEGVMPPHPPPAGIRFLSSRGERRFCALGYPALPTEEEFRARDDDGLITLLRRALADPDASGSARR